MIKVNPDTGYYGLGEVGIAVQTENRSLTVTENGNYMVESEDKFIDKVEVVVNVSGAQPVLEDLQVTENGTYTPDEGVDGFSSVQVDVPSDPVLEEKEFNSNGWYKADPGYDGFGEVYVNVSGLEPTLTTLDVSSNGTYTPYTGIDGWNNVVVNVPTGGMDITELFNGTLSVISSPASSMGGYIFSYFSNLRMVNLPNCSRIETFAFRECSSLSQVNIENCRMIDANAFEGCSSLEEVIASGCITIRDRAFNMCGSLKSMNLPSCQSIMSSAFYSCGISTISIPYCSYIGVGAFGNCSSLTTISLPYCSYIGAGAFTDCPSLSEVYLTYDGIVSTNANWEEYEQPVFDIYGRFPVIYVPAGRIEAYRNHSYWRIYSDKFSPINI